MSDMTPQEAADWVDAHSGDCGGAEMWAALRVLRGHARSVPGAGAVRDAADESAELPGIQSVRDVADALVYNCGPLSGASKQALGRQLVGSLRRLTAHRCAPSVAAPPREDESPGTRLSRESIEMHRASRSAGTVHDPEREP